MVVRASCSLVIIYSEQDARTTYLSPYPLVSLSPPLPIYPLYPISPSPALAFSSSHASYKSGRRLRVLAICCS